MQFDVLGPFRVTSDGQEVALGGTKQRALLAMLVLEANARVSRDMLMEGLWGERLPPSAEHTLDGYVSRLRKAIGRERIERSAGGYQLRVEQGELDLDAFDQLTREGHVALEAGDPAAAAASLAAALALWRGAALSDLLDEPFAALKVPRLEERRLAVLEERIDVELARGAGPELVPELELLSREHPYRERLLAALMLALYRAGRQAAALEVYRGARRRFSEDLGIEPGPRLRQLEQRILEHDSTLAATAVVVTPSRPVRSPSRLIAAVAAVAVVAAVGAGVAISRHGRSSPRPAGAPGVSNVLGIGTSGAVVEAARLPGAPASVAYGGGSVWISDTAGNQLLRSDPETGAVADRIPLPAQPGELAVGGGSVWVAATGGATVMRIDETTDGITQVIRLGSSPTGLAFGAGSLWVGDPVDAAILRIEPSTGSVEQTINVGAQPAAIAVARDRVWVAGYDSGTVVEVDPRAGATIASVAVGQGPVALAFASGSLWVANRLDGTVSEIDPRTLRMLRTLPTGSAPIALSASGDSLWVADEYSRSLARINAAQGVIRSQTPLNGEPVAITRVGRPAAAKPSVWVATMPQAERHGGTLVLLDTRRFLSIDPQVDYEATPPGFLGLVNDTLVAFDHTTGTNGFQPVPDLALRLPQTTDGGKTYSFELRPDLRYSDGRLLRASDFARSMIRLFRVRSPGSSFFAGLIGGARCLRDRAHCRLSSGVVADDASRTVTFRLTAADPDFLFKLALGFVVPIPPGTPMHEVHTRPIVGTGPYVFSSVTAKQFVFTRNPRFEEWSHAAQPDGNPDRIIWRFGLTAEQELRAVVAGHADWAGDFPSDISAVARNYAANLHSNTFPGAYFVQLNTRRPPFNDIRVRRAFNNAVDRAVLVRLSGGPILNAPLCQVIPPGLPGYHPYCPYTRQPNADGHWRAPNLRRADALVSASKTRGASVTVWSVSDNGSPEPAAPYLASVLQRLGYRAHVRVITTRQQSAMSARELAAMQLQLVTFGPDYPSASEIYSLFLACDGAFNHDEFCDPKLDLQAQRAEALRVVNAKRSALLWAKIDRALVNQAVWVPLTTQRILDFVSTRLRDYQFSPVYHFLPAQAAIR